MPEICPILALGIYLLTFPLQASQLSLFPGSNQYDRYSKLLQRVFKDDAVRNSPRSRATHFPTFLALLSCVLGLQFCHRFQVTSGPGAPIVRVCPTSLFLFYPIFFLKQYLISQAEIQALGVAQADIGTHSVRKGATTYCTSGTTACPTTQSVNIRGGWTSPGVGVSLFLI